MQNDMIIMHHSYCAQQKIRIIRAIRGRKNFRNLNYKNL